jgi:uncharacterized protein
MEISRTFDVIAPRDRVWEFITCPQRVVPCMPGCEQVEESAPGQFKARLKVKVGPIKTSFSVDVTTTDERAPEFAAYLIKGQEGSRASHLNAESTLSLEAIDDQRTNVTYASRIKLVGRLGMFAGGVMKKLADSMSDEFVDALRAELEPQGARPTQQK